MAYPKLSPEKAKGLAEMLKDPAVSIDAAAEKFGVGKTTAYRYLPQERRRPPVKLIGERFGKWTVLERDDEASRREQRGRYWAKCDCGVKRSVLRKELLNGTTTMCANCREAEQEK